MKLTKHLNRRHSLLTSVTIAFVLCITCLTFKASAQNIIAATDPTITTGFPSMSGTPVPTHLSCDGLKYNSTRTMKVFAWDGRNQGWAYDDGSEVINMPLYVHSTTNAVYHPEIALIYNSISTCIFALIVYEDVTSGTGSYYEAYAWSGTAFPTTPTNSGSIATVLSSSVVINNAGDEYGHFAIVYDNGTSTGTSIGQLSGYIDNSCQFTLGTPGTITYNSNTMTQPDVDITFGNYSAPKDADVFLAFITSPDNKIVAASIPFGSLLAGGAYDIVTNHNEIGSVKNSCAVDHPSISVNDGYAAYLYSYTTHAAVSYQEDCHGAQSIYLFGVTPGGATVSPVVLNQTVSTVATNQHPTVVAEPIEVYTVTAWDFDAMGASAYNSLGFYIEGLAHGATYDISTNTYDRTVTGDMQVQTSIGAGGTGFRNTTVTTISGFDQASLLYFYYDDASGAKNLEYKVRPYYNTALRKANKELLKAGIYPNPATSRVTLTDADEITSAQLSDATGRLILSASGNNQQIENILNKKLIAFDSGLYFLKLTNTDGLIGTIKFIKQ